LAYSLLRNRLGSMLLAGCVSAGCYTSPVNMAPTVLINQQSQPYRGQSLSYTASASDPDHDPVTLSWATKAGPCPDNFFDSAKWPDASQWGPAEAPNQPFSVGTPVTLDAFCVWVKATDSWGASTLDAVDGMPKNHPPVAVIGLVSPPAASSFPLGTTFQVTAMGSSDADGDALHECWLFKTKPVGVADLEACSTQFGEASNVERSFTATVAGTYDVELQVSDGIDTTSIDATFTVEQGHVPTADLELVSPMGAGPYPLGSVIHVSGAHSTLPDPGDVLTCVWDPLDLSGAPGSIATLAQCPNATSACDQCFTADAPGTYRVTLEASDQTGTSQPTSLSFVVDPDEPPCLGTTDPAFTSPLLSESVDDMVVFNVVTVTDDLDPYPDPSSPLDIAHFTWLESTNGAPFAPFSDDFPRAPLGAGRLGDVVRVRLEIRDRDTDRSAKEFLACGDADVCFTGAESDGCFQRVTWTVSYNR
jgi:hypothetical protein